MNANAGPIIPEILIALSQATMAEAISLAKELNDAHALVVAVFCAAILAHLGRKSAEVERWTSELLELCTRHHFAFFVPHSWMLRGWARAVSGSTAEGIAWLDDGIRAFRASGTILGGGYLAMKAEALHLDGRTREALEIIKEAEALVESSGEGWCRAELHRLRGVFLAALGAEEALIEASFCAAIRIAKEQKSVLLAKRAEATYAEYRRQKASGSGARRFRLPLC